MHVGAGPSQGHHWRTSGTMLSGERHGLAESDPACVESAPEDSDAGGSLPEGCRNVQDDRSEGSGRLVVDPTGAPGASSDTASTAESDDSACRYEDQFLPEADSDLVADGPEPEAGSHGAGGSPAEDPLGALASSSAQYKWAACCRDGGSCRLFDTLPLLQPWSTSGITPSQRMTSRTNWPPQRQTTSLFGE